MPGAILAVLLAAFAGDPVRAECMVPEQPVPEQPVPEQPAPEQPAPEQASPEQVVVGRRVFLLNLDRSAIEVDGAAGVDFTRLGAVPHVGELEAGGETRRALVQAPGSEVAFPGVLPYPGELSFGVAFAGLAAGRPRGLFLAVVARSDAGEETTLWRERVRRPAVEAERRWREASVDVSAAPPGDLLLRVELPPGYEGPDPPLRALPAWGNPVLEGRGRERPRVAADHRNVVIFLIDTLRADRVGAYGYGRPTTPVFDGLAREGALFLRAYAASSWTKASVASLFTSRPPSLHGAEDFPHRLRDSEVTLAEVFRDAGYATGAVGANLWIFYPLFNFGDGFDDFLQSFDARGVGGPAADVVVDEAIDWLERHCDEPFLLYVHVTDPHTPYDPPGGPGPFLERPYAGTVAGTVSGPGAFVDREPDELDDEDLRYLAALYDAEIAFADAQMGRLVERLRTLGVWEETTFAVLSDHGEEFGEHGGWEHSSTLYEEQIRVPLLIVPPASEGRSARRVERAVSLLDVAPTLCELAGVPAAGTPFRGTSLFEPPSPAPLVLSELNLQDRRLYALTDGDLKYVAAVRPEPSEELYRLGRDAGERDNAVESASPERLQALRERLARLRSQAAPEGLYVELCAGAAPSRVRGALRSDLPLSDVNPVRTEYFLEGEHMQGDQAFFADGERRLVIMELRVGPGDERDFVYVHVPDGAELTLEIEAAGPRPELRLGSGAERARLPLRFSADEEVLVVPEIPAPAESERPVLRVFRLRREEVELDADRLERLRALGYAAGGDG